MNSKEYLIEASNTDTLDYPGVIKRLSISPMLAHAIMGIVTEAGELEDAYKKWVIYNKEIDPVNLKEELGDLEWYIALLMRYLDTNHEEIWEMNIRKLRIRYPHKFTEFDTLNRNLEIERQSLESK